MNTEKTKSKYKFLVLIDKSKASYNGLKNAVSLAKLIDGSIDILQVTSPTSVVTQENQIASMAAMGEEASKQKKELQHLVDDIVNEDKNITVNYSFTIGNVKNEIKNHVDKTKPDIIVLGKRKNKMINILGDQVTEELLKTHNGGLLICSKKEVSTSYSDQSIGFLNNLYGLEKLSFVEDIKRLTEKPIKIFRNKDDKKSNSVGVNIENSGKQSTNEDNIIFEFDSNKSTDDMANFISKNNLALLCINNKEQKNQSFLSTLNNTLKKTIEKTNTPVLVLNNN